MATTSEANPSPDMSMTTQQVATKTIVIDGREYPVKVYAPKQQLRQRVERAREVRSFELEAEARAEARYLGIDLGAGYGA